MLYEIGGIVILLLSLLIYNYNRNMCCIRAKSLKLWYDHVAYTREHLIAVFTNSANIESSATRLMRNQDDIGAFFGCYYGASVGASVTSLLKEHIIGASKIVETIKYGKPDIVARQKEWNKNGEEIGEALDDILKITGSKKMMQDHLDLTTKEVLSLSKKDFAQSLIDYEAALEEALSMAEMIATATAHANKTILATSITLPCCG